MTSTPTPRIGIVFRYWDDYATQWCQLKLKGEVLERLWQEIKKLIPPGSDLVYLTTTNHVGSLFEQLWRQIKPEVNRQ